MSYEEVLQSATPQALNKFFKNIKQMTHVKRNKTGYSENMMNIMTLYSDLQDKPMLNINPATLNKHMTLSDYNDIFKDFRRTLMGARTKNQKVGQLFNLGKKSDALMKYFYDYEPMFASKVYNDTSDDETSTSDDEDDDIKNITDAMMDID